MNSTGFSEFCRICLEKNNLISIFSKISFKHFESTIEDVLSSFQKIQYGLDKHTGICHHCKTLVQATFELKTQLEISTEHLKNQTNIALENIENKEKMNANNIEHDHNYDTYISNFDENSVEFSVKSPLNEITEKTSKLQTIKHRQPKSKIIHLCPICSKELTALDLRQHIQTHKTLRKYLSIPKVSESAVFYTHQREIVSLINKNEKNIYKCLYCEERLSLEDFWIHQETHNSETEHQCDKCDRIFRKISHLNIHQHYHKQDFSYRCSICEKGFILKKNYDCHLLTHTNTELPHSCEYCNKRFANPLHLQRHIIIHTENRSYNQKYKVWKCRICLKTFEANNDLLKHPCSGTSLCVKDKYNNFNQNNKNKKLNVKSKIYSCKLCPKFLRSASGLYMHVQTKHHGKVKKKLCTVCGKYVRNFSYHMKRHNGVPDFKCYLCSKGFFLRKSLEQHLLVHSGQKPYICSSCGKTFNNLHNLQVHERIHIGFKSHLCSICGKAFLEKSYLGKHMKVHKNIEK